MTRLDSEKKILGLELKSFFFSFDFIDSFVNSQEWTLSRLVPDLRLVSFSLFLFNLLTESVNRLLKNQKKKK